MSEQNTVNLILFAFLMFFQGGVLVGIGIGWLWARRKQKYQMADFHEPVHVKWSPAIGRAHRLIREMNRN